VKAPAPRSLATLFVALLGLLLASPATAPASPGAETPAASRPAIGGAQVVKRGKWRQRRARAMRRRRQATARDQAASKSASKIKAAPALAPGILFDGDFEAGFNGWHVQSLSDRASLVGGALQGSQAARFEVQSSDVEPQTGSQRSEVSGPIFDEGEELYIRDAIRLPEGNTYSVPWQIVEQLHEEDWSGSPGMAVMLDNDRALSLGSGDSSRTFWEGPSLQTNRWYDLVYRVNLSQDPGAGFVEVWLDGAPQELVNGQTRMYGETIQAAQTYLKAGIYRSHSSTGTTIVEHDAIVVGSSYAAVAGD